MRATRVAILGATGSVGRQALEVISAKPDRLCVSRTAHRGDDLVAIATADDVEVVLVATPGIAGLDATLAALKAGKRVALASKEVLVSAGHLVRAASGRAGDSLRPVDSEQWAVWQCLAGRPPEHVRRVVITASGGPFRETPLPQLPSVTPDEALRHPTWRMGPKVTVDSATLVNKAYEVIEAHWLYGVPYDRIDVVVHPESVVHAIVELLDGSFIAQLAAPDMRLPIQYALLWEPAPSPARRLDFTAPLQLRFCGPPDPKRYPCYEAIMRIVRSADLRALIAAQAADEVAVGRFLAGSLAFGGIADLIETAVSSVAGGGTEPSLPEIHAIDHAVHALLAGTLPVSSVEEVS